MPRLRRDAVEPCPHRRILPEVEPALLGDVCVAVQRDVGDRERVADEPLAAVEVLLERGERAVSRGPLPLELGCVLLALAEDRDLEAGNAEVRLDLVLLEEHPL